MPFRKISYSRSGAGNIEDSLEHLIISEGREAIKVYWVMSKASGAILEGLPLAKDGTISALKAIMLKMDWHSVQKAMSSFKNK